MKTKYLFILFFTVAASLLSIDMVMTSSFTPPSVRTNAPGEGNCSACHSSVVNSGPGSISFTFSDSQNEYKPDSTYTITVTVTDATKSRFGFEMTALDGTNSKAGSFTVLNSSNTGIQTASVSGKIREYINHRSAGSNKTWTFEWTAPSSDAGDITFYIAANCTNSNGSTSGDNIYTQSFGITPAPLPPVAEFSADKVTACINDNVTFTDNSANATSWQWNFGADAVPSTASAQGPHTVTFAASGLKTIELIVSGAAGTDTMTKTDYVNINLTPAAPSVTRKGDTLFCSVVASSYEWYLNGNAIPSSNSQFYLIAQDGDYSVMITDGNGCTATSSPFTFVGVNEILTAEDLQVYPNPTTDYMVLSGIFVKKNDLQISILNVVGAPVYDKKIALSGAFTEKIPLEHLPAGIYLLQLKNGEKMLARKIVKE